MGEPVVHTTRILVFAWAFGLHGIDHLQRGNGGISAINHGWRDDPGNFVVVAAVRMLRHHRRASGAAIAVGFGSAVLFVYAHLLPTFLPSFQDSFISGPRINVTWFSWLTAVAEIGTGLTLGYVGLQARRRASCGPIRPGLPRNPLTE